MGQIISSFPPVLIISYPCHPWEPDWYSISCVSIYWTLLLLLSHTGAFCRNKMQVRMYIFVRREGFPMAQPSWEGIFAASDRAPRSQWREWNSSANFYQLLRIIKEGKARSICDGNFAQTESQISYLGQVVTSSVPLLRKWCSYLSILSDGRRSPCFSLSCLSAFQCQFATFYSFATPYLNSKVLILILEWKTFLYKPDSSW